MVLKNLSAPMGSIPTRNALWGHFFVCLCRKPCLTIENVMDYTFYRGRHIETGKKEWRKTRDDKGKMVVRKRTGVRIRDAIRFQCLNFYTGHYADAGGLEPRGNL